LDYKLNNKIFFIALGLYAVNQAHDTRFSCLNNSIIYPFYETQYFIVVDAVGNIPRPLLDVDYSGGSYGYCTAIYPVPGDVVINYGTWKDLCTIYRNPKYGWLSEHSIHLRLYRLLNFRNACTSCSYFPMFANVLFDTGEYIKIRLYYKRFKRKDLC